MVYFRRWLPLVVVCSLLSPTSGARAELLFNVIYEDVQFSTSIGFDDATYGEARRDTLAAAFAYVSSQLDPIVYNTTVDFVIRQSFEDSSSNLAWAAHYMFINPTSYQNGLLYEHATNGGDPDPSNPDAHAAFSFAYAWHLGTESNPGNLHDLFSTALHEITHAMGFNSQIWYEDGSSYLVSRNPAVPGVYTVFDSFLERGDGTKLFNGAVGVFTGTTEDLLSNDIYFGGSNARAANGGNAVKLFAHDGAFSYSHLDTQYRLSTVMDPFSYLGEETREWSALDRAILRDLGWKLIEVQSEPQVVPEPSSLLLLAIGSAMGVACQFVKRRQVKSSLI